MRGGTLASFVDTLPCKVFPFTFAQRAWATVRNAALRSGLVVFRQRARPPATLLAVLN